MKHSFMVIKLTPEYPFNLDIEVCVGERGQGLARGEREVEKAQESSARLTELALCY